MRKKEITLNISSVMIVKIVAVLLGLVFLYFVRDVVIIFFTAVVIASALSPAIDFLERKRIPRTLSVIVIFLFLLSSVALSIYLLIPPIVNQVKDLSSQFPNLYDQIFPEKYRTPGFSLKTELLDDLQRVINSLSGGVSETTRGIFATVFKFFGGIFSGFAIFVLSIYMVIQKKALENFVRAILPSAKQNHIIELVKRAQLKIGAWLSGQLILCLILGILAFLGLEILGVKYALVLAIFAGITEIIPYIGPVIGGVPAIFLALTQSPVLALFVLILFILIHQTENHILVPKIMQRAVGLNPVLVILALLIGGRIAGILGVILAVPIATGISVFVKDYMELRSKRRIVE